ncbi:MAG: hypothetical protein ACTHU0_36740 [Kofleriaceae bacterium]
MTLTSGVVGQDAGWHLTFFTEPPGVRIPKLSIGAGDYHSEISAALPAGLEGGAYSFVIEGITNAHYKVLHEIWSAKPARPLYVDLYLYWRDTGGVLGYLASVASLTGTLDRLAGAPPDEQRVARLVVTRLSRRVGTRRYEAVIEARERVFAALAQRLPKTVTAATATELAVAVAKKLKIAGEEHPFVATPSDGPAPRLEALTGKKGTKELARLEDAMKVESKRGGLPMYVIRDGKLHVGPGRKIPLEGKTKPLDAEGGLVHVETTAQSTVDQTADAEAPIAIPPPSHLQYALTLKGRPDLRPGDAVSFADPFSDGMGNLLDPASALNATTTPSSFGEALAGMGRSFLGASEVVGGPATMYVTSVSHRLSRTEGFVTTLAGIGIQPGKEWDPVPEPGSPGASPPAATPHDELAGAMQDLVKAMQPEGLGVGEVRAAKASGTGEPPGQTVDVWVGLTGNDGKPSRARRLAVDRDRKARQNGVPTVSPFAWGKCGLVVPRYPGTRVVLAHAGNAPDDAVELGALWESGHGPDARPGDWWLILPASVASNLRSSIGDEDIPREPTGSATHDLIDADGERTIEVGRLTVRVKPNKLPPPGVRPDPVSDSAERVTIEHESGSRIVIKEDGDIVITSSKDLTLSTKNTLTLEADDVKVKVTNTMDVRDR